MQEGVITIARLVIAYSIMGVTGTIGLVARILSLGALTNPIRRFVGASSRLILRLIGVRAVLPPRAALDRGVVMYTFNHNSFLDVLLITALGLEDTRCFLSERTLKFIPVTISALAIGTLYIPQTRHAERRARFFARTTERIARERFSVIVSSEGVHEFIHGIAPFNTGVYHMAIDAGLPVVPIYIHIPRNVNSLEGYRYESGTVRIEVLPTVGSDEWTHDRIDEHVTSVREIFVERFDEAHGVERDESVAV
jgi:1-acyl-sn-glycerol-3-phosphate acyltransferase